MLVILGKMRKACKILTGNPKGKQHLRIAGWY
jgi:hypothetical protein